MKLIKGIGAVIGVVASFGFVALIIKFFEPASDEELAETYEKIRLDWLKNGGDKPYSMERIDSEMLRRANEKYEREHPNSETVHREHGRYLPNDD